MLIVLGWIIEIVGWIVMILRTLVTCASFSKDFSSGGLSAALWLGALNYILTFAIFAAIVWFGRWLKSKGKQNR
jgi:hypothetical protein